MNMLIEKKIELGDIIAVKLLSGEEVVGKLRAMSDFGLSISRPLVLGMQQSVDPATGRPELGMGFAPFMLALSDDGSITLKFDAMTVYIKARKEISDAYTQSTTGIEVPSTSSLVV